jgi:hypothetical protein
VKQRDVEVLEKAVETAEKLGVFRAIWKAIKKVLTKARR